MIIQDTGDGDVEVAAIDPAASMERIGNSALTDLAESVGTKLRKVIQSL